MPMVRPARSGTGRPAWAARIASTFAVMSAGKGATFGPVIACGAGGVTAELLKDVAVGVAPLTDRDARDMVRALRTFPLLDGFRGTPRCDVAAVEDALLRLSAMVERHPEIAELDANPLIARPDGALIVDARVRIAAVS